MPAAKPAFTLYPLIKDASTVLHCRLSDCLCLVCAQLPTLPPVLQQCPLHVVEGEDSFIFYPVRTRSLGHQQKPPSNVLESSANPDRRLPRPNQAARPLLEIQVLLYADNPSCNWLSRKNWDIVLSTSTVLA
jgi:hypothetical protein